MSDEPSSEVEEDGKGRFLTFWTTLPGILTGVAAVITAAVGLITLLNSGSSDNQTPAVSQPAAAVPTPGTTSATEPGATGAKPSQGVLARGPLTMIRGDQADLESGVIEISPNADISFGPESTPTLHATATAFLAPTPGPASKEACATALSARHDGFEIIPQLDTEWICVSTTEAHVAAVRIVGAPGVGSAQLRLEYTVWD